MNWTPSGHLERPENWEDYPEQWRRIKAGPAYVGKSPPKYQSEDGFNYWVEVEGPRILTSDPSIFLSFHGWGAHDYDGHSYALLHDRGDRIVITSQPKAPNEICFSHDLADKTEDVVQFWRVDQLFRRFTIPDHESYPWVGLAHALPKVEVAGLEGFRSREHQERVVRLIETLLSCRGGSDLAALRGEKTQGKVVIGEELLEQLKLGTLIVGDD